MDAKQEKGRIGSEKMGLTKIIAAVLAFISIISTLVSCADDKDETPVALVTEADNTTDMYALVESTEAENNINESISIGGLVTVSARAEETTQEKTSATEAVEETEAATLAQARVSETTTAAAIAGVTQQIAEEPIETTTKAVSWTAERLFSETSLPYHEPRSIELEVIDLINAERRARGLGDLTYNAVLSAGAYVRAQELVASFGHTRPNGQGFWTAWPEDVEYNSDGDVIGLRENIIWGNDVSEATDLVGWWMDSPSHKNAILASDSEYVGVAAYYCNGDVYCVTWFGSIK